VTLAAEPWRPTRAAAHACIGMPGDRHARLAARRAFVELKQTFLQSLADLEEPRFDGLRHQVRGTEEPLELWLLRAPVFAALSRPEPDFRRRRQLVRRALDAVFHDGEPTSGFGPL
jgi:hypothetical protein